MGNNDFLDEYLPDKDNEATDNENIHALDNLPLSTEYRKCKVTSKGISEDQKIIIGDDAERLSAANKMRVLLSQLNLSGRIPWLFPDLSELQDIAEKQKFGRLVDGPDVIAYIRNTMVHGKQINRKRFSIVSAEAKEQALHLSIWYIELCLLKILGHKGTYASRTTEDDYSSSPVPWASL